MKLSMMNLKKLLSLAASRMGRVGIVLAGAFLGVAAAQSPTQTVDRIKSAYIYNFAKFVEFPASEDQTIRLCLVGKGDLNGALPGLNHRGVTRASAGLQSGVCG